MRPEQSDSNFTWKDFADKINNELLKNLGNFVHRSLTFTNGTFGGIVPSVSGDIGDLEKKLLLNVNEQLSDYLKQMDEVKLKNGLRIVMLISSLGNGYLQDSQPWVLAKSDKVACGNAIAFSLGLVHLLAVLMEPFMPGFSEKVYHQLNIDSYDIPNVWDGATVPAGHKICDTIVPLFKTISDADVASYKAKYGSSDMITAAEGDDKVIDKKKGRGGKTVKDESRKDIAPIARVELRVGKIIKVWEHPAADKLWAEEVDLGETCGVRTICSGLRDHYTADEILGRKVVVVANLKPRAMKGIESQGMVLCGKNSDGSKIEFLDVPEGAEVGELITVEGGPAPDPDDVINSGKKGKPSPWESVVPDLKTNESKLATYEGKLLMTSAGPLSVATLIDSPLN